MFMGRESSKLTLKLEEILKNLKQVIQGHHKQSGVQVLIQLEMAGCRYGAEHCGYEAKHGCYT